MDEKFNRFIGVQQDNKVKEILQDYGISQEKLERTYFDVICTEMIDRIFDCNDTENTLLKQLYDLITNVDNYNLDYSVAITMLQGNEMATKRYCPIEMKEVPFDVEEDKISCWCREAQEILSPSDENKSFIKILESEKDNARIEYFSYQRMKKLEDKLEKKIKKSIADEEKLVEQKRELEVIEKLDLKEYRSQTRNRKENYILLDYILGNTLTEVICYYISDIYCKNEEMYNDIIKSIASLKCYELRNSVADIIFKNISEGENILDKEMKDNLQQLLEKLNQYYCHSLTLYWSMVKNECAQNQNVDILESSIESIMIARNIYYEYESDIDYKTKKELGIYPLERFGDPLTAEFFADILNNIIGENEISQLVETRRKENEKRFNTIPRISKSKKKTDIITIYTKIHKEVVWAYYLENIVK